MISSMLSSLINFPFSIISFLLLLYKHDRLVQILLSNVPKYTLKFSTNNLNAQKFNKIYQ